MNLDQLAQQVERTYGQYEARKVRVGQLTEEVAQLEADIGLLGLTEAALSTLLAEVSKENLQQIETLVTYGLHMVFDNHPLQFRFVQTQQRGGPSLEPVLVAADGAESPILDAHGGGPAAVVGFLLRLIVCHRLGLYPLILLDEAFAMVSAEYVDNVAKLLKELAKQLNTTFVLVTQQRSGSFLEQADRAYELRETPDGVTFVENR